MDNLWRKRANVEEVKSLNLYLICLWWFDKPTSYRNVNFSGGCVYGHKKALAGVLNNLFLNTPQEWRISCNIGRPLSIWLDPWTFRLLVVRRSRRLASFPGADFALLVFALEHLALRARLHLGPMRFFKFFGALIIPLKDHQRRDHDRQGGCEIQSLARLFPAHDVLQK
jgi:hypothetical protein